MAVHQPHLHLLDFSLPPNAMPMDAPPPAAFDSDDGLLALHVDDGTHMPAGSGGVLQGAGGDTAPPPWPQAAMSLSLFSYSTATRASSSLQVGHHGQQFTASVASPNHQLGQVPAASLQQPFQLRSSKYLGPVRELLSEFCSHEGDFHAMADKQRAPKAGRWDDDVEAVMSSAGLWGTPSLSSMDLMELERRKARLLSMIQEVDRRYRRYREQMRSVEVSFEAVAGAGAAQVYTRLARRAMSRQFRCLRDALTGQVRALRKAMGAERDEGLAAPAGATKGDTPRLRVLDQCLRQPARAVDSYPWRRQRGLPERAVAVLRAWLFEHFLHPYPNAVDKHILARQTGLSKSQVSNWFINARVRLWKPMIEDMYKEEVNGQQNPSGGGGTAAIVKAERSTTALFHPGGYQSYHHHHHQQHFVAAAANHPNTSSIISQSSASIVTDVGDHNLFHSYPNLQTPPHGSHQHSAVVSLTLGLQQQPLGAASSMMQMQQQQQRSAGLNIWEGGQEEQQGVQLLPYRNLMGSSQLLHDLAGTDSCL